MGAIRKMSDKVSKKDDAEVRSVGCETTNQSSQSVMKVRSIKNDINNNVLQENSIYVTIKETANLLGLSKRAVEKNIKNGKYTTITGDNPEKHGPRQVVLIALSSLPVEAQEKYWESLAREDLKEAEKKAGDDPIANRIIAKHKLENEIEESKTIVDTLPEKAEKSIIIKAIESDKVKTKLEIIKEAIAVPAGWKVKEWQTAVAVKHKITYSTLRRWIEKMDKGGVALLVHQNTAKEKIFRWSQEGIEALRGLYLKRAHRKMSKKQIYKLLKEDASRKGYVIGSYSSALTYLRQFEKENDLLLKYRDQGIRGLDNHLPPIRRKYEDLDPFEIIVGDQHRFDFWVVDEETGKRFRPEMYLWQDLCTRCLYGVSVGKKYDSNMMGEALWMGIKIFGVAKTAYTDNGGPETSKYFFEKKTSLDIIGLKYDGDMDEVEIEKVEELSGVYADLGMKRRLAKVRNAKAKMIEGTFRIIEDLLIDFGVTGYTHKLGGNKEENEIDDKEIELLHKNGQLLTFREFCSIFFKVCDYYNKQKHHKGLLDQIRREKIANKFDINNVTPYTYLLYRYSEGWRPQFVSDEALELIFMSREKRKINKGIITFNYNLYTADELTGFADGTEVEIRYNKYDLERLLVFRRGEYVCDAYKIEYSSMKDEELAKAKIRKKAELRKKWVAIYNQYVQPFADARIKSNTKYEIEAERRAQLTTKQAELKAYQGRVMTDEERKRELEELKALEERVKEKKEQRRKMELPERPAFFMSELKKYMWLHNYLLEGGEITEEDKEFMKNYEAVKDLSVFIIERREKGVSI